MEKDKTVRKPRQKRSVETKEKILDAAYRLFCEKGYYETTTNEIAKVADVSIGSLYSYFLDKDTIFMEILGRYNQAFVAVDEEAGRNTELYRNDKKEWLRRLTEEMIRVHENSRQLNREIHVLSFTKPEVAAVVKENHEKTRQIALDYFKTYRDDLRVKDVEAAALISYNLISSIVDQIVFEENTIDRERILNEGMDALYQYLVG
jgi:Transcriptional regulator